MYERMLNKQVEPSIEEMTAFCGENAERFSSLNEWLESAFHTEQKVVFPYGNHYGWGVAHKIKGKLICNIFAEDNAFTVTAGGFIIVSQARSILRIVRHC